MVPMVPAMNYRHRVERRHVTSLELTESSDTENDTEHHMPIGIPIGKWYVYVLHIQFG